MIQPEKELFGAVAFMLLSGAVGLFIPVGGVPVDCAIAPDTTPKPSAKNIAGNILLSCVHLNPPGARFRAV